MMFKPSINKKKLKNRFSLLCMIIIAVIYYSKRIHMYFKRTLHITLKPKPLKCIIRQITATQALIGPEEIFDDMNISPELLESQPLVKKILVILKSP